MGNGLATYYKTETRSNAYNTTDRYRFGGKELDTRGGLFHYDFDARHYDPVLPMFNGYDPMAEDNIHVSPLAYCHGNPVMFIDPTGEDEYFIGPTGIITKTNKTEEFDRIILVDAEGNTRKAANGEDLSVQYSYGTLSLEKGLSAVDGNGNKQEYDVLSIKGDDNGTKLFKFLSDNITSESSVEFGQIKTGNSKQGINYITNSHTEGEELGAGRLFLDKLQFTGVNIREMTHSHPLGDSASQSDKDKAGVIYNLQKSNKRFLPRFYIYHTPSKTYVRYYPNTKVKMHWGKRIKIKR